MAQPLNNLRTRQAGDIGDWTGGANSAVPAINVPSSQYAWGENVTNRGNVLQTRPGMELRDMVDNNGDPIPDGIPQGMTMFEQIDRSIWMVFAISGRVYFSKRPFTTFSRIPNIQFDPNAPQVVFKAATKGARYEPDVGLQIISPYNVLIMQDGRTQAAFWDGANSGHIDPSPGAKGTPIGLWMEWTGSRLWIASGQRVYASDILDPLSFTEGDYLAEKDGFWFPGPVTGLIKSAQSEALLVFTADSVSALQANITVRTQWQQTSNFQRVIIPSIGCVAGKSLMNYCGLTWWLSGDGLTNIDAALNTYQTGRIVYKDEEMSRSKGNLSPLLAYACSGAFSNYLMVSVPHADVIWNRHTWVMDASVASLMNSSAPPCWAGVWTGIRPVEWASYQQDGKTRIFCLSNDYHFYKESKAHVWEVFTDDRRDNNQPIPCSIETRAFLVDNDFRQFKYAEIDIRELYGEVAVQAYFGGIKGPWIKCLDTVLQAEGGSINSIIQEIISDDSVIEAFNPQTRTIRTQEISGGSFNTDGDVCGIESTKKGNIDKAFQLRIDWQGRMAISRIRIYTDADSTGVSGKCMESENGDHNIINDEGEGIHYEEQSAQEPPPAT